MAENYKCPGCGASMVYEEGSDFLVCPYCDTRVPVKDVKQKEKSAPKKQTKTEHFHCANCGGELDTDAFTAATICPFCGSPTVLEERLSGEGKPDVLIPFSIGKDQAKEIFRKWTKSGIFTPRGFSGQSTLDSVTGLYVPYWLFDFDMSVHMDAEATRVRTKRKGDYEYTYTDHYLLTRDTESSFECLPADASEKMPDDIMERLEPYDYQQLRDFDMPYLSGYLAECRNYEAERLRPRAEERAREYAIRATRDTMDGYTAVIVRDSSARGRLKQQEYAMMPVWMLSYRYKGKDWKLYLNGQSGRKIGSLPIDKGRVAACYGIVSAALTLLSALIWGLIR